MGITNTQYLLVRHLDQPHPHCHLVYNRSETTGRPFRTRTSKSATPRSAGELTEKYGLYLAPGKDDVRRSGCANPTRPNTKSTMRSKRSLPKCKNWNELEGKLKANKASASVTSIAELPTANKGCCSRKRFRVLRIEDRPGFQLYETRQPVQPYSTAGPTPGHAPRNPRRRRQLPFGICRVIRQHGQRRRQYARRTAIGKPPGKAGVFRCRRPVRPSEGSAGQLQPSRRKS